jgi:hypothetical protein
MQGMGSNCSIRAGAGDIPGNGRNLAGGRDEAGGRFADPIENVETAGTGQAGQLIE